jgi:hypothetical protein
MVDHTYVILNVVTTQEKMIYVTEEGKGVNNIYSRNFCLTLSLN